MTNQRYVVVASRGETTEVDGVVGRTVTSSSAEMLMGG